MSVVYFTDMTTTPGMGLLDKLRILVEKAGISRIIKKDDLVAVKIHFGEYGNMAYIRPNYTRVIADRIKSLGGKPFLTDANTLYKGSRTNAVDHLWTATVNGFAQEVTGMPVIIADGLRGNDETEVPIDGEYVKNAKIGSAIALADVIIAITHFKGHEQTGFGGTLKNLGMGSASRAGKLEQHSTSKPVVNVDNCTACGMCERYCPTGAVKVVKFENGKRYAVIDYDTCIGCGQCVAMCNYGAMVPQWNASSELLSMKIAEYTKAVLKDKKGLFVSFITNVSPDCDCWSINRPPVAPDIGIAASTDPVALDQACIDLVIKQVGKDPFKEAHPDVSWEAQLAHAEKIGLGSRKYELQNVGIALR
ncbi:DUF362 domain-containing protein [Athalassotoga saccharophila]|uniref:DUF362 domain-containing protein n=1 Tax=Athalassotoga saccharophila TaxID=1441386 RepID=UPI00137AADE0|nr:DUF362 domain-containing protein [Athalassotoga saccharophila]BBJ28845.1 NAD(P)H-quinone oxidoreductase subunit I, chloroplastic [Athalassotoga saccharophila]